MDNEENSLKIEMLDDMISMLDIKASVMSGALYLYNIGINNKAELLTLLNSDPIKIAYGLGYTGFKIWHNRVLKKLIFSDKNYTFQAHRGSFKTTLVSLAIAIRMVLFPKNPMLFTRKTDENVKEVVRQITKFLKTSLFQAISKFLNNSDIRFSIETQSILDTNLNTSTSGTPQLTASGINGNITGQHYDRIYTDDIITREDRYSVAKREDTKRFIQELENVLNRKPGCATISTGTPWHKDDGFTLLGVDEVMDCYNSGMMSEKDIAEKRKKMTHSLFAANYELKHIAQEDLMFDSPRYFDDEKLLMGGRAHIDAGYGGEDSTAFTIAVKDGVNYKMFGKCYHKHVNDCLNEILNLCIMFNVREISLEDNADKGYLASSIRDELNKKGYGLAINLYHESMNKYFKISTYLKDAWEDIEFYKATDEDYMDEVLEFSMEAPHDDCPDSASSIIRGFTKPKVQVGFAHRG